MHHQQTDPTQALIDRYVAVWNERDPDRRRAAVAGLWAPDGLMINRFTCYEGIDAVIEGATRSFDEFVARGFRFQAERFTAHHSALVFFWLMRDPRDTPVSRGINYITLDEPGRIALDHQFAQ